MRSAALLAAMLFAIVPVRADDVGPTDDPRPPISRDGIPKPSIATSLPPEIGGLGGVRQALAKRGIQVGVNYIGEVLGNTSGGLRRGAIYEGRLEMVLDADLERTIGWKDLQLHAVAFQIHGRGLSRYNIGDIEPASNIEATRATRLYDAWLEQTWLNDKVSLRVGQQGGDVEFISSSYAGLFINGTFGWPTITALNLPSGGPAYPLATPAIRLKVAPSKNFTFLGAIFNGDPAGPAGPGKNAAPQVRNPDGVRFRVKDPPFVIAEAQFKYEFAGLGGTANLGAWTHLGKFADQRFATDFTSLADPNGSGMAIQRRGNSGIYGVLDQQIYAVPETDGKGVGVFFRAAASPSDRNLVNLYFDGGINFTGIIPSRPDDAFGIAGAYVKISPRAAAFDRDAQFYTGNLTPIRTAEATIEATYNYRVVPGFSLQPNIQYVIRPSGGVVDPSDPAGLRRIHNAAIFGLRSTIRF